MAMLGWCLTGQHPSCIAVLRFVDLDWNTSIRCSCTCHEEEGGPDA